jgi:hypothetical protein
MDESQQAHLLEHLAQELFNDASPYTRFGSTIARLLDLHLHELPENLPEWHGRWMDDVLDVRIEVKGIDVEVLGYVVWGNDGTTAQWLDPLRAVFTRDMQEKIIGYELQFCDAQRSSQPFQLHRQRQSTAEMDWTYRFRWKNQSV